MNKSIIILLLALASLGGSQAFASEATTLVMGTGDAGAVLNGGSLYYDDAYNIFYNPAYINDFKNWAIIEKSNGPQATNTTAQGGFAYTFGNINFGIYLNRGDAIANSTSYATPGGGNSIGFDTTAYAGGTATTPVRPVEAFVGTDLGAAKVGLGLLYASNTNPAGDSSFLALSGGAEIMGLEPFATVSVASKDSTTQSNHKFYRLGARYHFGEFVPYAAFTYIGNPTPGVLLNNSERNWVAGIGRDTKVADSTRLLYSASYVHSTDSNAGNYTRNVLPLYVALEGDALTWLTLRGGLGYHLIDRYSGSSPQSASDNTTGRIGATVHVNKVDFEFAVGKNAGTKEGTADADAQNFDFANGLFSAANLTYHI